MYLASKVDTNYHELNYHLCHIIITIGRATAFVRLRHRLEEGAYRHEAFGFLGNRCDFLGPTTAGVAASARHHSRSMPCVTSIGFGTLYGQVPQMTAVHIYPSVCSVLALTVLI